ncbi:MAG: hypothetical protein ACREIU_00750 [Planctomycetota bacterium]
MRKHAWLVSAVLLSLPTGTAVSLNRGGPANGSPNIDGNWIGKIRSRDFDLSGGSGPGFGTAKCEIGLLIAQTGNNLSIQVTITCADSPTPFVFLSTGEVGNAHFWAELTPASEGVSSDEILFSGAITGNGTKMKGAGIAIFDGSAVSEFKFNARLLPPPR